MTQSAPIWVEAASPSVSLASYLEVPFMHKRLILACTLAGILAGWLAILVWPRSYESEAKLMMRVGREVYSSDPTATTSSTMSLQKSQQEEIVSALTVLGSRQIAEVVVDQLGPEVILSGQLPGVEQEAEQGGGGGNTIGERLNAAAQAAKSWLYKMTLTAGISSEISDRELAVMELLSSIKVDSPVDSTIVNIKARAKNARDGPDDRRKSYRIVLQRALGGVAH